MKNNELKQGSASTDAFLEPLKLAGDFKKDIVTFEVYCEYIRSKHQYIAEHDSLEGEKLVQDNVVRMLDQHAKKYFMEIHGRILYEKLTENYLLKLNLNQLLEKLSRLLPGLLQTLGSFIADSEQERLRQKEIDNNAGVFFWGVLRHSESGNHLIESMLLPTKGAEQLLQQFETDGQVILEKLTVTMKGKAGVITFQNSDSLNAEDNELIRDMETAVDLVLLSKKVQVGVLRGGIVNHPKYEGKRIFSAGINLKHLHLGKISFVDFLLGREFGYINKMIRGIRVKNELSETLYNDINKPWLSVVDTFAIGGGMQLLLACDYVIGESGSYISLPAAKEGIVPGVANLRLSHMMHERIAKQVILHGRRIWANEEDGKLMFDHVVGADKMKEAIDTAIDILAAPAVVANKKMLLLSREPVDLFRQYMSEFALQQCERMFSDDVYNKVSRFAAKS